MNPMPNILVKEIDNSIVKWPMGMVTEEPCSYPLYKVLACCWEALPGQAN